MAAKKPVKKSATGAEKKGQVKFVKVSVLPKAELEKINLDELWVMKPLEGKKLTAAKKKALSLCGCRNVCLA